MKCFIFVSKAVKKDSDKKEIFFSGFKKIFGIYERGTLPEMKTAGVKTAKVIIKHRDSEVSLHGVETWPYYLLIM